MPKKQYILIILAVVCSNLIILLLAATPQLSSRYQIETSGVYPDVFVFDRQTNELIRYTFYAELYDIDKQENILIESFGTVENPEYRVIDTLKGYKWKNYKSRPSPFGYE